MTAVAYSLDILPRESIVVMDKSPAKPRRRISGLDVNVVIPTSTKSLDCNRSMGSSKKKKKKKTLDPIASSSHSVSSSKKKKNKKSKKKKKKDALSQSAHAPSSQKEERPLGSDGQTTRRPKKRGMPSRRNKLTRTHSVPIIAGYASDGDSTMEGSDHDSLSKSGDEPSPILGARKKIPSEMEAFLDKIISDAKVSTGQLDSIRKNSRGRSRTGRSEKKAKDQLVKLNDSTGSERRKSDSFVALPKPKTVQQRASTGGGKRPKSLMSLLDESSRSSATPKTRGSSASTSGGNGKPKSFKSESPSSKAGNTTGSHVVSLSIEGEEKTFTLSESDLGAIEAFLQNKTKEPATVQLTPPRAARRSTSASRAAKRLELFDHVDPLLKSDRSAASADMAGKMRGGDLLVQSERDELLFSERIDHSHRHQSPGILAKKSNNMSNLQRFDMIRQMAGDSNHRLIKTGSMVPSRPRSLSVERTSKHWQDMHDSRLAMMELETISDEGSYSLSRSSTRRWSLSDSMSGSRRSRSRSRRYSLENSSLSTRTPKRLEQLNENKEKFPVESRFTKKDWEENGPFNVARIPRKGKKPASIYRSSDSIDGKVDATTKQKLSRDERKARKDASPSAPDQVPDQGLRRSRSGGRRPKNSGKQLTIQRSMSTSDDEGDDYIIDSPGQLGGRATFLRQERWEDEASFLDVSCKGQTLEQLAAISSHRSKLETYEQLAGDNGGELTPGRTAKDTKKSPMRNSTPNGARVYKLDLGEARWTTTPTTHLKGKASTVDPLDLHLPFESGDYGSRPTSILKTATLGLVEPSTLRKRSSTKDRKKRIDEEGGVLEFDEDNATVVSDITEAVFDSSIRSTLTTSTSMRSTAMNHDDFEESLKGKWEPKIEKITETNSQSELLSSKGDLSAASPAALKDIGPEISPQPLAAPGETKRFSWMKKLPFSKKK